MLYSMLSISKMHGEFR